MVGIQSNKTAILRPLDPQERDMLSIYDLVWESLIRINDDYLPEPYLCQRWEASSNGRTWTLYLRDDVYFSDGTKLEAADVAATINAILNRARQENSTDLGYYQNLRYFIDSVSVKNNSTVVIKVPSGRGYWGVLYALTFPILKEGQETTDNPLGTGPYVIDNFVQGSYMTLTTNSYWWNGRPQVKDISVTFEETPSAVMSSYEYGRVDTIFTRSISAAQYKSGTSSLAIDYRTNQLECLLMNHSYTKLNSKPVRQAIRYAVDVDKIAKNIYLGMVDRTNSVMPAGTWMYNTAVDSAYVTDLEKARQLLDDDGWSDSNKDGILDKPTEDGKSLLELTFDLYVYEEPDNNVRVETANMIASMLAEIGMEVSVKTVSISGMMEKLEAGAFHLALVSYAMDVVPDYGFMLMGGNTGNYCRYRNSDMTTLCKELRTCQNQQEYRDKLFQISQKLADDCPFIPMYYRKGTALTRKMYTTVRDVREYTILRGIESFKTN